MSNYELRLLEPKLLATIARQKSVLLLGARQTGKTTLLKHLCKPTLSYNLMIVSQRQQFERDPDSLSAEIEAYWLQNPGGEIPLVIVDEIQKVPQLMDVAQYIIDNARAQFILTGSSARKLKTHKAGINLLPGRVVMLHLDAFTLLEMRDPLPTLENLLLYGSLPGIHFDKANTHREEDLISYVRIYLEEEIRQEALVRNLGAFSRFLELAAISVGEPINYTRISQDIGISVNLIIEYFQILEDCLIIDRINPITESATRKKLTKAPKYLFFDLGVKRIAAKEGQRLSQKSLSSLFEQFVGMELLRYIRLYAPNGHLKYWRDHGGPEIDFVIDLNHTYIPVEVKWTENPSPKDSRHLEKFMDEYPCGNMSYIVCRVARKQKISDRVIALPWKELIDLCKLIQECQ
jgi:predicted AAA+ superfamily ATPase